MKNNFETFKSGHGKKPNQKLKPYLVLQYLLRNTDEEHIEKTEDIISYLNECGIAAERRSIYRDIDEINLILWVIENDGTIEEAEEAIAADESEKAVIYDKSRKGFYVQKRQFEFDDIRALAECVHSARFLTKGQANGLIEALCGFTSEHNAEKIRGDVLLTDRSETNNKGMLYNISTINEAMSSGKSHTPEKITFNYLTYALKGSAANQTERRKGARYKVSPYKLIISDGKYYLLAFDDKSRQIRTFRVDRMKNVSFTGEARDGGEEIAAIDVESYARRTFSMYDGEDEHVTIRFINPLLDTVVDKFGSAAVYGKVDNEHFSARVKVNVSDQFFAWVFGFGKRAKLLAPPPIVEQFKGYLDKVRKIYE